MGKRSDFPRRERDFYPTPSEAFAPLVPHLPPDARIAEPCAGNGALVDHMRAAGFTVPLATDVEPQRADVLKLDAPALNAAVLDAARATAIVTNPPWSRPIMHPLIEHLRQWGLPLWILADADWMHTAQSRDLMDFCSEVVPIGRVKWIPDSKHWGKDNAAWYRFGAAPAPCRFWPRGRAA